MVSPPASIEDIAPSQYSPGAVPGSLAAPPLSPYVSRKLHLNCFFFFFNSLLYICLSSCWDDL